MENIETLWNKYFSYSLKEQQAYMTKESFASALLEYHNSIPIEPQVILPERNSFGQWIDIKEQRPTERGDYLVICEEGIRTACYNQWNYWEGDNFAEESSSSPEYSSVTHWMPLPPLPKL